jgi:adenylate cyclase
VERLVAQSDRLEAASREATTIAFLDMQGFTPIAERLGAADLVRLLNAYLEEMSIPVGSNQGVTDKYIGDAIMAFWSPVFVREGEPAALACRAALAQRERLGTLRHRLRHELTCRSSRRRSRPAAASPPARCSPAASARSTRATTR